MKILLFFISFFIFLSDVHAKGNRDYYKANGLMYSIVKPDNISNTSGGTFYEDPDADAFGLLFIRGENKDMLRMESEVFYGETPSEFGLSPTVRANIKTIHLMQNFLFDVGITQTSNFVFGIGGGAHLSMVETDAGGGNDKDDDENFGLVYNVSAGFDINERIELLFRYSDYGKVEGGSNTTGGAPKFDYITHSLIFKYKF